MIVSIGTKPVPVSLTDTEGRSWKATARPMLAADQVVATQADPSVGAAAEWALVRLESATGPDGADIGFRFDGGEAKAAGDLTEAQQRLVVRGFGELAAAIYTAAVEAGLRVDDERGN